MQDRARRYEYDVRVRCAGAPVDGTKTRLRLAKCAGQQPEYRRRSWSVQRHVANLSRRTVIDVVAPVRASSIEERRRGSGRSSRPPTRLQAIAPSVRRRRTSENVWWQAPPVSREPLEWRLHIPIP